MMNPLPKPTAEDFRAMSELFSMLIHWYYDDTIGERVKLDRKSVV